MAQETFYDIFKQLNQTPRPSHHEERIADFLCEFAEKHGLRYRRDAQNCVVIEKAATPGHENAQPVVILNHMDMVCVAKDGYQRDGRPFDALHDEIRAYTETVKNPDGSETRWMKAEGTSLGADNGMGLSMALAILADDSIVHGPLEVLTTTNEEDGMSGAEALSTDFIRGRKVVNLDSEAYDEITTGAAGAYLQIAHFKIVKRTIPEGFVFRRLVIDGGLGGHSGVDINKGRCHANREICRFLAEFSSGKMLICSINGGTANASISSTAEAVIAIALDHESALMQAVAARGQQLKTQFETADPHIDFRCEPCTPQSEYIANASDIVLAVNELPIGMLAMRDDMPGTVMTSNNAGRICTTEAEVTISCHSRSFSNEEMRALGQGITAIFKKHGAMEVALLMDTPAWMERADSPLVALTCQTFRDVLGFEPKRVAMHFVLEAAYYVQKYPGVEIASIGPLIIEPYSTSERVNLDTADNIWRVTLELLKRLA